MTWSHKLARQLHIDWQSFPYIGKGHFMSQLAPVYPISHAKQTLKCISKYLTRVKKCIGMWSNQLNPDRFDAPTKHISHNIQRNVPKTYIDIMFTNYMIWYSNISKPICFSFCPNYTSFDFFLDCLVQNRYADSVTCITGIYTDKCNYICM